MNSSNRLVVVGTLLVCVTGLCFGGMLLLSYRISHIAADRTLGSNRNLLAFDRGYFSPIGTKDVKVPSWIFQYGDKRVFDVIVRVQVSLLGNVLTIYPKELIGNSKSQ